MKKNIIISCLLVIFLISCEKNKNPIQPNTSWTVVSLNKGNLFYYHKYSLFGGVLTDWFSYDKVTGDTLINKIIYSIFNNKRIERADKIRLYSYYKGNEIIKLEYDINNGDIIPFLSKIVSVDSIKQEDVFSKEQIVIYVSNKEFDSDTLILGKYTRIFGVLSYSEKYNNHITGYSLSGALINENKYGEIHQ